MILTNVHVRLYFITDIVHIGLTLMCIYCRTTFMILAYFIAYFYTSTIISILLFMRLLAVGPI